MAGLVPAIHGLIRSGATWMPGTRPGMTKRVLIYESNCEMPHTVEKVTVAGAAVRLFRGGPEGAEPLVFLHGAGGHTGWMPFLDELAGQFEVFAPEHPGFGQSDDPPWLDEVADLAYFHLDLLAGLGLDRVHLIGTSLGGWVAAEMA